jgi:hypothetical protein
LTDPAGSPDLTKTGNSYVERNNLTMRLGMRRFTRLTGVVVQEAVEVVERRTYLRSLEDADVALCEDDASGRVCKRRFRECLVRWSCAETAALREGRQVTVERHP